MEGTTVNLSRPLGVALLAVAFALPSLSSLGAQAPRGVAALPPAWVPPPVAQYPAPQVVADLMSHGGWYGTVDLRNAINNGLVQGPRMQVAGPGMINASPAAARIPLLDREPISSLGHRVARTPAGVREAVDEHARAGVNWIKIYSTNQYILKADGTIEVTPTFTLEETQAIVDEAHGKGLKVACHAYGGEGLRNCIAAGVDVPTHGLDLDDASLKLLLEKHLQLTVTKFNLRIEHAAV